MKENDLEDMFGRGAVSPCERRARGMVRVLHLMKTSIGGGWALRQMRELVKAGIEVHVAIPTDGPLIEKYREYGVVVHAISYSLKNLLASIRRLREIVEEVRPDIIHSHFVLTTLIMRIGLRDIPIPRVFQVPGPLHLENWFFRNLEIHLAQKNDFWCGSCEWTNACYEQSGIDRERIFLAYYGGDLTKIYKREGSLKKTLGLKQSDIVIGMVAFMYAPKRYLGQKRGLKGHEDFIDALAMLIDDFPNLYGVCIGGAWNGATKYERKIVDYGKKRCGERLRFLGTRKDVFDLYGDMYIAVHPSHSENLGGAAESMLLEVPTIATDVGGFPDLVKHEETGLLVPPKNPNALAEAIRSMLQGKYELDTFKKKAKALALKLVDVKVNAQDVLEMYSSILARKSL